MKIDTIIDLTFMYGAISIVCNFTFAVLPLFLIWGWDMSRESRIILVPILGMACVASVAVVVRMAFAINMRESDFLWATVDIAIWGDIEQGLAITAGSLATLHPLWHQFSSNLSITASGSPFADLEPTGLRTPQWKGTPSHETRKKMGLFRLSSTFFQPENGALRDNMDDYSMGDFLPLRLRDDLIPETAREKSDKGFKTWTIQAGKVSNEDFRHGAITMQREVYQETEIM